MKQAEAEELKIEKAELIRRKEKADRAELVFIKKRIQEISEADKNANAAREALQEEKARLVKTQLKEKEKIMKKKEKEDQEQFDCNLPLVTCCASIQLIIASNGKKEAYNKRDSNAGSRIN